jgi:N-acetylmuramoyl-L-alanine amidase
MRWLAVACLAASVGACSPGGAQTVGGAQASSSGGSAQHGATGTRSPRSGAGSESAPTASAKPLTGAVIVLDPGHNGDNWAHPEITNRLVNVITEWKPCDTTGTQTDAGYAEHAFTYNVARRLATMLKVEGATVILTRRDDHSVGPCITRRAAIANRAHDKVAISIHADGGPSSGSGFEVIEPGLVSGHNNKIISPSRRLGLDVRNAYRRITGEPYANYIGRDGLDVRTDLGGLNLSTVPKVFIECGNMRNAADAARLSSPAFRQRIARALAAGLTAFLAPARAG